MRRVTARVVRSLRLDIHALRSELLKDLPYAEELDRGSFSATKFLDDVLTHVEGSPPAMIYVQSLWLTPIIVVSEILGNDDFERSYVAIMRASLLQALRTTLSALCIHAHRRALEDKKLR